MVFSLPTIECQNGIVLWSKKARAIDKICEELAEIRNLNMVFKELKVESFRYLQKLVLMTCLRKRA